MSFLKCTAKRTAVTFDWSAEFEAGLGKLLLTYRLAARAEGSIERELDFERGVARDFARGLRTLIESQAPSLAGDSDIDALMGRLRLAHDGAQERETRRMER